MDIYEFFSSDFVTCPDCGSRCDEHGLNEGQTQCPNPNCGKEFFFEIKDEEDTAS